MRANSAALLAGAHSAAFWEAHAAVARSIVEAIVEDAGHASVADAPKALQIAADAIAQTTLVAQSAFQRVVEAGGPLTAADRARRAFTLWLQALDRQERLLRLVGLKRVPKQGMNLDEYLRARAAERPQEACEGADDVQAAGGDEQAAEGRAGRSAGTVGSEEGGSDRQ